MEHFLGYHNTKKMGFPASKLESPRIYTSNSVRRLPSQAVWLISGEGSSPKSFYLAAVFKVNRVCAGTYEHPSFENSAHGEGRIFGESICLNGLPWFEALKEEMLNFKNGLAPLQNEVALEELRCLAGRYAL